MIASVFLLDQSQEKYRVVDKLRKLVDVLKEMNEEEYRYIKQWLKNLADSSLTEEEQDSLKELVEKSNPSEVEKMVNNYARSVGAYKEEGIQIGIEIGMEKGIERGIERGIEQGKKEMVKNFLSIGISVDKIIKASGMSKEEIEQIKNNIVV